LPIDLGKKQGVIFHYGRIWIREKNWRTTKASEGRIAFIWFNLSSSGGNDRKGASYEKPYTLTFSSNKTDGENSIGVYTRSD
jgi:hypothetical protein